MFVNYSLFDNVPLVPGGVTVNRFSPGFEKTVLDGWASFEMRFPLASTLDSSFAVDGPAQTGRVQFGDLYMVGKYLVARTERAVLSAGLVLTVPTANDLQVFLSSGEQLVQVRNQTVHLMPFLGWLYARAVFRSRICRRRRGYQRQRSAGEPTGQWTLAVGQDPGHDDAGRECIERILGFPPAG